MNESLEKFSTETCKNNATVTIRKNKNYKIKVASTKRNDPLITYKLLIAELTSYLEAENVVPQPKDGINRKFLVRLFVAKC